MRVNEKDSPWRDGLTLAVLRAREDPDADIVILNGFPVDSEDWDKTVIGEEDEVTLVRRGVIPTRGELRRMVQARHTPRIANCLAKATVGIAGLGGLGSHVAHALARSGIGRLVLADVDVVEPTNLNRQIYAIEDIGIPKAEAIVEDLEHIAPLTKISSHHAMLTAENIPDLFADCSIVVECFDRPEMKRMLVETVLLKMRKVTVVAASGLAGTEDSNLIHTRRVGGRFYLVGDETNAAAFGRGLLAPRVMVAAGHQANAVLRILLGEME